MKDKKPVWIAAAVLAAVALFAGFGIYGRGGADTAPTNVAAVSDAASDAATQTDGPTPEPTPALHCGFDEAVEAYLAENGADTDLDADPAPLYGYLAEQGIDPAELESSGCENEYAEGYIRWAEENGGVWDLSYLYPQGSEIHLKTYSPEEMEEMYREFERAQEEAARQAEERWANIESWHGEGNNF